MAELGIDTVINLRGTSNSTRAEEAEARKFGLNYFNLSLPNWGRPDDGRIRRILAIIAAPESGQVFVHCKDGLDRTGTVVALHRITHLGWTSRDALAEAERHGMRRIQFWMRDYVEDYHSPVHTRTSETARQYHSDGDLGDRVGAGVRIAEREVLRVRRILRRLL